MVSRSLLVTCAGVLYFVTALGGGALALWIANLSKKWMQFCNALAGGVVIGVALCHMLADNVDKLDDWGNAINVALGGDPDDSMPLSLALVGLGFFLVVGIEYMLSGHHNHDASQQMLDQPAAAMEAGSADANCDRSSTNTSESQHDEVIVKQTNHNLAGITTLAGLTIHSTIEGVATGATQSAGTFGILVLAVLLHKGFAAFAVAASFQNLARNNQTLWWLLVVAFACTGPVGLGAGAIFAADVEGQGSALLQCLAAGTLLAVGINEMLMPSLSDTGVWKKRKLCVAFFGYAIMAVLSVWA